MARYAISDIHGCVRTFKKALREVNFSKQDTLILIGDYIDRGLDSKGVVDHIIQLQEDGYNVIPLKGNHEDFLLRARENFEVYKSWMWNGGRQTLESYACKLPIAYIEDYVNAIGEKHWKWYESLDTIYVTHDYVFVHGGLEFQGDDPLTDTTEDTAMWTRIYRIPGKSRSHLIGGRVLVTGHTPTDKATMIEMTRGEDLITIDRGCVFNSSEYGHLAIINLDDKQIRFIKNIDLLERDM